MEVAVVKTRSIATKVALVVSAVVIGALALTGWFALKRSDAELVRLQLSQASTRLTTNLGIAQRIFDERFPGPWQLAPGTPLIFRAGPSAPAETLTTQLFKGRSPVYGNAEVTAALVELSRLTGTKLSIAQRAGNDRALRLATSDTLTVTSFYGRLSYFPSGLSVTQGSQRFDVVDPATSAQVGAFTPGRAARTRQPRSGRRATARKCGRSARRRHRHRHPAAATGPLHGHAASRPRHWRRRARP